MLIRKLLIAATALLLASCGGGDGGGGSSSPPPPPAQTVAITVSPATVTLAAGGTAQFQCAVTGSTNTACTWSVDGAGTISAAGLYTAPAAAGTATVRATSAADGTKSATAAVTVTAPAPQVTVTITPATVSIATGASQQFTCAVTNGTGQACTWSATGGNITANGLYTAPAAPGTYQVTASRDGASAAAAVTVTGTTTAATPWVTGYYGGYFWENLYEPQEVDMTGMTHIVLARVAPGGGSIPAPGKVPGDIVNAGGTFHDSDHPFTPRPGMSAEDWMVEQAHAKGVKVILMLGGDGDDGIGFNLSTADNLRTKFVKNIVDYLVAHGYDGVDVDWENRLADGCSAQDCGTAIAGTESIRRLKALIQEIRTEANKRPQFQGSPVLVTFPGYTIKLNEMPDQYQVDVANMVDQYNLMSYGLGSTYAGAGWASWFTSPIFGAYWAASQNDPSAPIDLDNSIKAYAAAGVTDARKKIGIGIGFYGTAFGLNMKDKNGQQGRTPRLETENVKFYNLGEEGYEYYMLKELGYIDAGQLVFDNEAQAIYRTYPAAQYPQGFIPTISPHNQRDGIAYVTYENGQSIHAKGNWVRNGGAAGTIIWMINYGDTGNTNTLMADVKCAFLQRGCPGPMTP